MATVTGARGTGNIASFTRKIDMSEAVLLLQPDASPLTVFTKKTSKKVTSNPEFKWAEQDLEPRFDLTNGSALVGATSIVVDNGAYFAQHDLVRVPRTGEVFRVTAVTTNTLTVVRGVGSTAAALLDNEELVIIGSAQPEGDTSKPARSSNPLSYTNYTQIIRRPVEATRTHMQSASMFNDHDWNHQRKLAGIEHAKDLEMVLLMGRPSEDLSGSQPRRTTGGAYHYVSTNQTDAAGALTETEFFGALRPAFRYGNKTKLALCSALAVDVLNTFPRGKVQVVDQGRQEYGINVVRFISPHGTLNIATHWLLEGATYGGHILILDMEEVKYRFLQNENGSSDTHIRDSIQANDADTRKDEYLTECGLQFGEDKKHALITGITG